MHQWSSAILIERGLTELIDDVEEFQPKESGHLHFFCLDEIDIPLWKLIDPSDEPDFSGFLP